MTEAAHSNFDEHLKCVGGVRDGPVSEPPGFSCSWAHRAAPREFYPAATSHASRGLLLMREVALAGAAVPRMPLREMQRMRTGGRSVRPSRSSACHRALSLRRSPALGHSKALPAATCSTSDTACPKLPLTDSHTRVMTVLAGRGHLLGRELSGNIWAPQNDHVLGARISCTCPAGVSTGQRPSTSK